MTAVVCAMVGLIPGLATTFVGLSDSDKDRLRDEARNEVTKTVTETVTEPEAK